MYFNYSSHEFIQHHGLIQLILRLSEDGWSIQPKYRFKLFDSDYPRYWKYCFFSNYLMNDIVAQQQTYEQKTFKLFETK